MAVESCDNIYVLPEDCIANALSLTTPKDVCRLSAVASRFRSASESDTVWDRFLPSDYRDILARADGGADSLLDKFHSKKDLYLHLCDHPVLIDGGRKSFSLDKLSGKKCYMLSPRELFIVWGGTPQYWKWISLPESRSRFSEVAELLNVCWLEIRGKMKMSMLSADTNYAAYLVFTNTKTIYGFDHVPGEAFVVANGVESARHSICLDREGAQKQIVPRNVGVFYHRLPRLRMQEEQNSSWDQNTVYPRRREDGWLEVELGEYLVQGGGESGDLEVTMLDVKGGNWKRGIIVGGIEVRPKRV